MGCICQYHSGGALTRDIVWEFHSYQVIISVGKRFDGRGTKSLPLLLGSVMACHDYRFVESWRQQLDVVLFKRRQERKLYTSSRLSGGNGVIQLD